MGRFLNPKVSSFQDILNSQIYVDKTGIIEYTNHAIDTTAKFICNSRPRRFGKTITAYYCKDHDSEKMFQGLKISQTADFKKYLKVSTVKTSKLI